MANTQIDEAFAPLVANGTTNGYLTVADTSKFYIHAFGYLVSNTQPSQLCRITDKPTLTTLQVQFYNPETFLALYGKASDCSAYTLADQAKFDQFQQIVDIPEVDYILAGGGGGGGGGPIVLSGDTNGPSNANTTSKINNKTFLEMDFIYDPSIAATDVLRYKTIAELMTAVTAGPKGSRVLFTANATIPSNWVLPQDTRWYSITPATGQITVTIPAGVTISNLRGIEFGLVVKFLNTGPCLTWPADVGIPIVFYVGLGAALDRSGSGADLAQIPDMVYGVYAVNEDSGKAVPSPAAYAVMRGMGMGTVLIGSQVSVSFAGGIIPGDFAGSGSLILQNGIGSTVLTAADFPAFTGTITSQIYSADPRNFGPQLAKTVLAGPLSGGPDLPTFKPIGSLLSNLYTQLITEIWVGAPLDPMVTPTGSPIAPFPNYASAMAYIATRPEEYFKVNVAPDMSGDITVPPNKGILFECSTIHGATINDMVIYGSDDAQHPVFLIGIYSVNSINFNGASSTKGVLAIHQFCEVLSSVTTTGGIETHIYANGIFEATSQTAPITFQDINLNPNSKIYAENVDFQDYIVAGEITIKNSRIPDNIDTYELDLYLEKNTLSTSVTINFLGGSGTIHADAYTTKNLDSAGLTIVNGVLSRDEDLEETHFSFVTPPTLEGQLYSYVSNSMIDLSSATALVLARAFAGVYNNHDGAIQGTVGRVYPIRIEPNLVPNPGEPIYLSKLFPGLGTTTKPNVSGDIIKVVAYIVDTTGYNSINPNGSTVFGKLSPLQLAYVP
jgi:hypothetical protein